MENNSNDIGMAESHSLIPTKNKLSGLHGLRAIAAISVVFFHLKSIAGLSLPQPLNQIIEHFYLSVQLFFVLSAFSLYHSHTTSQQTTLNYICKRYFRIAPLFYTMIAFQIWRVGMPDIKTLFFNLIFIFNLIPGFESSINWAGWSVGVEFLFYILLPAIFWVDSKNIKVYFFAVLLLISIIISAIIWQVSNIPSLKLPPNFAYFSIFANLAPFSAGLLAYKIFTRFHLQQWKSMDWIFFAGLFFLFLAIAYFDLLNLHAHVPGLYFSFWGITFSILCLWQSIYPSGLLKSAVIQWLADRSFSIYLLHPVVIEYGKPIYYHLRNTNGLDGIELYIVCALLTAPILFVLANITFRYIEMPGIELGRKIISKCNL